jgi:hypothetical protein
MGGAASRLAARMMRRARSVRRLCPAWRAGVAQADGMLRFVADRRCKRVHDGKPEVDRSFNARRP